MDELPVGDCMVCGAPQGFPCTKACDDDSVPDEAVPWRYCVSCRREMSESLDAYFGRDESQARRCVGCRR